MSVLEVHVEVMLKTEDIIDFGSIINLKLLLISHLKGLLTS